MIGLDCMISAEKRINAKNMISAKKRRGAEDPVAAKG